MSSKNSKSATQVFVPIEINNIERFQQDFTSFRKDDLRVLIMDQQNRVIYLPISEIGGGGSGGTQDLQSVADLGRVWINDSDPDNIRVFSMGASEIEDDAFIWQGKENVLALNKNRFRFLSGKLVDDPDNPTVARIELVGEIPLTLGTLTFKLPNDKPYEDGTFKGEYTLSTIDDISLQKIVDNIAIASVDDGNSEIRLLSGTPNNRIISLRTEDDESGSGLDMNINQVQLTNSTATGEIGQFGVDGGLVNFKQSNYISGALTSISFETPIALGAGAEIKIPALNTGVYTFGIKIKPYTVSTLPIGTIGDTAYVTDAMTPTYLGVLIGGGTAVVPVFYNGTAWVSH